MAAAAGARDRVGRLRGLPGTGAEREDFLPRAAGARCDASRSTRARARAPPWPMILLDELAGVTPECEPLPIGCGLENTDADAVLLDRRPCDTVGGAGGVSRFGTWARSGSTGPACRLCSPPGSPGRTWRPRRWKRCWRLPAIAAWPISPRLPLPKRRALGIDYDLAFHYLRDNLHFTLGEPELNGLKRFAQLAADRDLVPRDAIRALAQLSIYGCTHQ